MRRFRFSFSAQGKLTSFSVIMLFTQHYPNSEHCVNVQKTYLYYNTLIKPEQVIWCLLESLTETELGAEPTGVYS